MSVHNSEVADPEPGFKFAVGQKVFCQHSPLMYEARCVKAETREGVPQYLIHYHGWNKNWDEWVTEERLVDYTDENKKKADQLSKEAKNQKRGSAGSKVFKRKSTVSTSDSLAGISSIPSLSYIKTEKESTTTEIKLPGGKESSAAIKSSQSASVVATPTTSTNKQAKEEAKVEQASSGKVGAKKGRKPKVARVDIDDIQLMENNNGLRIEMPSELAEILIDDMHYVTQQNMILKLQDTKSIDQLLSDYVKRRKEEIENKKSPHNNDIKSALQDPEKGLNENSGKITEISCYVEVCSGIKRYFNEMLGSQLLYKYERPQFANILRQIVAKEGMAKDESEPDQTGDRFRSRKNSSASKNVETTPPEADGHSERQNQQGKQHLVEYYSPIHLLRLCTKLDKILSTIQMDEKAVKIIVSVVSDLLAYLKEERDRLFLPSHYTPVPPDYDRMAT